MNRDTAAALLRKYSHEGEIAALPESVSEDLLAALEAALDEGCCEPVATAREWSDAGEGARAAEWMSVGVWSPDDIPEGCDEPYGPPECVGNDPLAHEWIGPHSWVGGCETNPGVRGSGHGSVSVAWVCRLCGCRRTMDYGATDTSDGSRCTRTCYEPGAVSTADLAAYWIDIGEEPPAEADDLRLEIREARLPDLVSSCEIWAAEAEYVARPPRIVCRGVAENDLPSLAAELLRGYEARWALPDDDDDNVAIVEAV